MKILCGVDDSAPALQAARAAAALAKRAGEELELVHVQDVFLMHAAADPLGMGGVPIASQALLDAERERLQARLEPARAALAREFDLPVGLHFTYGLPERELARRALALQASLIVVGAIGRRSGSMWRLGSVPDRLSQSSPVPVLVVRDPEALTRWAQEERALRVVVALGTGRTSARAVEIAAELARLGVCETIEAHVYDPRHEARRLGFAHEDAPETRLAIERTLARELPERSGSAALGNVRFVAIPSRGAVAEALAEFVDEQRADLVVVGTRGAGALERRFLGSVAYGLLGLCRTSVLVACEREALAEVRAPVTVRRVLAATDFSPGGNRAVDYALALLPPDGQLTLLHVLTHPLFEDMVPVRDPLDPGPEERRMTRVLAQAELQKLIPARDGAAEVDFEAVEAADVSEAILQAAERHDADLVVLGRRGRSGLAAALMGSSARSVSRRSPRPVLVVPEAAEGG